jgi:hypothetical protein
VSIARQVGKMWNDEHEDVKTLWKAKANEVRATHAQVNPGYVYKPRKAGEVKRRNTKKKVTKKGKNVKRTSSEVSTSPSPAMSSGDEFNIPANSSESINNSIEAITSTTMPELATAITQATAATVKSIDPAIFQAARSNAEFVFPLVHPESFNDMNMDDQDINFDRSFTLPTTSTELAQLNLNVLAYNDIYGTTIPARSNHVVESSFIVEDTCNNEYTDMADLIALVHPSVVQPPRQAAAPIHDTTLRFNNSAAASSSNSTDELDNAAIAAIVNQLFEEMTNQSSDR